jgi:hypothetical protein
VEKRRCTEGRLLIRCGTARWKAALWRRERGLTEQLTVGRSCLALFLPTGTFATGVLAAGLLTTGPVFPVRIAFLRLLVEAASAREALGIAKGPEERRRAGLQFIAT